MFTNKAIALPPVLMMSVLTESAIFRRIQGSVSELRDEIAVVTSINTIE